MVLPPGWPAGRGMESSSTPLRRRWPGWSASSNCRPSTSLTKSAVCPGPPCATTTWRSAGWPRQHFIERGLRHFAFCGLRGNQWSDGRLRGFEQALSAARLDCHVFRQTERFSWGFWLRSPERELVALVDWLKNLPRPLGLFACNDERGMLLLSACRQAGLVVPRDVAVLGVDNDEVVCQLAAPELSSVVADSAGIGFEAARLLDRLMTERSAESGVHLVGPQGIVARQSTDLAAAWDRDVAAAIELIRQNAASGTGHRDGRRSGWRFPQPVAAEISGPARPNHSRRDRRASGRPHQASAGNQRPDVDCHRPPHRLRPRRISEHRFQTANRHVAGRISPAVPSARRFGSSRVFRLNRGGRGGRRGK